MKDNEAPIEVVKEMRRVLQDIHGSRLGDPIEGYEGKYWHVQEGDQKPTGWMLSGAGVRIPKCMHIPTGSEWSYIKVYLTLVDGRKIEAWKKHEKVV